MLNDRVPKPVPPCAGFTVQDAGATGDGDLGSPASAERPESASPSKPKPDGRRSIDLRLALPFVPICAAIDHAVLLVHHEVEAETEEKHVLEASRNSQYRWLLREGGAPSQLRGHLQNTNATASNDDRRPDNEQYDHRVLPSGQVRFGRGMSASLSRRPSVGMDALASPSRHLATASPPATSGVTPAMLGELALAST
jgi:hypothetical protein